MIQEQKKTGFDVVCDSQFISYQLYLVNWCLYYHISFGIVRHAAYDLLCQILRLHEITATGCYKKMEIMLLRNVSLKRRLIPFPTFAILAFILTQRNTLTKCASGEVKFVLFAIISKLTVVLEGYQALLEYFTTGFKKRVLKITVIEKQESLECKKLIEDHAYNLVYQTCILFTYGS